MEDFTEFPGIPGCYFPWPQFFQLWSSTDDSSSQKQNHRLVDVGRHLWVHLVQSLLKQWQGTQDDVQVTSEDLQEGGLTTSLGNLCQCFITCTRQKCFLMSGQNLLCFTFCQKRLVLSLGTTENNLASFSLHPSIQVFIHTDQNSLSLFFSMLNGPSSLRLSSQQRSSSLLMITFLVLCWILSRMSTSLLYWGAQNLTLH